MNYLSQTIIIYLSYVLQISIAEVLHNLQNGQLHFSF